MSPEAFAQAFREHNTFICRYLNRRTKNRQQAEDLASATFLRAWRYRASFTYGKPLPWLITFANRVLFDSLRIARSRRPATTSLHKRTLAGAVEMQFPCEQAERDLAEVEIVDWVEQVLSGLTPRQRTVMRMTADGYEPQDIEAAIGVSSNVVRQLKWRASRQLRKRLAAVA
jgi:RNA polymerase sigma factor (sigma-70 family)